MDVTRAMNRRQIIDCLNRGERLRWVPRTVFGFENPLPRCLMMARDFLDEDTQFLVVEMCVEGVLVSHEDAETGICDEFLR